MARNVLATDQPALEAGNHRGRDLGTFGGAWQAGPREYGPAEGGGAGGGGLRPLLCFLPNRVSDPRRP
jgi:hypothetical protein